MQNIELCKYRTFTLYNTFWPYAPVTFQLILTKENFLYKIVVWKILIFTFYYL